MDYLTELFNLEGRVAAVIGGGGYLCGEMARGLAKAGVKVVVLDKNAETRAGRVEEIREAGGIAMHLPIEATDKASHRAALAEIMAAYGRVDILINGAGINAPTPVLEIELDEFRAIYESHVLATLLGSLVLFVTDALRYEVIAVLIVLVLASTGCLTQQEAFAGFSSPAVVLIGAMYVPLLLFVGLEPPERSVKAILNHIQKTKDA
ncbi:MAG: SDR family NAD(P)-dependent oxidoreductase [SAR324 cluster bacterium]|nr:SDR family NAD(P)-dependent oxidoreductase [SAR324 cluster bacterium]